ncbi:MAG: type III pantothenate kinase [Candidatus Aminicenantes bacterium]|nr:type III pantothenate kinase [Candidatus Aminicenantes bacterium]MDH5385048.1 type III pantothenate kinase [Candidatus Aminicenantes bacterium]MDH5743944.1 type III pantothenate kinase [Candidatus Aminicenantes bacterium]
MLLVLDIGNTNIALGLFEGDNLIQHWKIRTERDKTCDEYGIVLLNLLSLTHLDAESIKSVIISSVVPPLTPVFQELGQNLFKMKPLIVGPGLKTGMPILYENPQEVGADRVVASVAAFEKYGGPAIVVDFGTATTFDAVSAKGEYLGGSIAPGIQIAAEALYLKTAKLPRIEIKKPQHAIGRTTVTSMQSGLYFGYIGLVSNIIKEFSKELGEDIKVVATGSFASQIYPDLELIEHLEPFLILEGLRIIHDRNKT